MTPMTTKMTPTTAALRGCWRGCIGSPCLQDVERREEGDPDDVHEVPVERCRLDRVVMTRAELAGEAPIEDHRKHHCAAEDVGTVEAGQRVERRSERRVGDPEAERRVVVGLADEEHDP